MNVIETDAEKTAITDLPIEAIEAILKFVNLYVDRRNCRSVSRVWRDSINRDSSVEKYVIKRKDKNMNILEFRLLVSEFLDYERQKISFEFNYVDLKETNDYWFEKGRQIIGLNFINCQTIPMEEILKYCTRVQEIKIDLCNPYEEDLMELMKKIAEKGIMNSSVEFLSTTCNFEVQLLIDFVQLLNAIFPNLEKLELINEDLFILHNYVNEISKSFADYNFKISVRDVQLYDRGSVVLFNSSPDVPTIRLIEIDTCEVLNNEDELLAFIKKYNYRDLSVLRISFDTGFSFLKFQDLISNSSLQILEIDVEDIPDVGVCSFKNQLESLKLITTSQTLIPIGENFVNSYQNLKSLKISHISFISFTDIINGLKALERFYVSCASSDVIEMYQNKTLTSETLKHLSLPTSFFTQTTTKFVYNLPNLTGFGLIDCRRTRADKDLILQQWYRNIDHEDLKCLICPKLKYLGISFLETLNQNGHEEYIQWMKNIFVLFPNIENLKLDYPHVMKDPSLIISDEELIDLLTINQKLEYISIYENIKKRIEGLRSEMKSQLE